MSKRQHKNVRDFMREAMAKLDEQTTYILDGSFVVLRRGKAVVKLDTFRLKGRLHQRSRMNIIMTLRVRLGIKQEEKCKPTTCSS